MNQHHIFVALLMNLCLLSSPIPSPGSGCCLPNCWLPHLWPQEVSSNFELDGCAEELVAREMGSKV